MAALDIEYQAAVQKNDAATMDRILADEFVLIYMPGSAWLEGKPTLEQPLKAHLDYMHRLKQTGKLTSGGPFMDNSGGLAIVEADDADEARTIMSADPAVREQVFKPEMHP